MIALPKLGAQGWLEPWQQFNIIACLLPRFAAGLSDLALLHIDLCLHKEPSVNFYHTSCFVHEKRSLNFTVLLKVVGSYWKSIKSCQECLNHVQSIAAFYSSSIG